MAGLNMYEVWSKVHSISDFRWAIEGLKSSAEGAKGQISGIDFSSNKTWSYLLNRNSQSFAMLFDDRVTDELSFDALVYYLDQLCSKGRISDSCVMTFDREIYVAFSKCLSDNKERASLECFKHISLDDDDKVLSFGGRQKIRIIVSSRGVNSLNDNSYFSSDEVGGLRLCQATMDEVHMGKKHFLPKDIVFDGDDVDYRYDKYDLPTLTERRTEGGYRWDLLISVPSVLSSLSMFVKKGIITDRVPVKCNFDFLRSLSYYMREAAEVKEVAKAKKYLHIDINFGRENYFKIGDSVVLFTIL